MWKNNPAASKLIMHLSPAAAGSLTFIDEEWKRQEKKSQNNQH